MLQRERNLKQLPYYKERAVSPKNTTVSCKVPPEVKDELEKHFENKYPESESPLSEGIRDVVYYYLNNICLDRKTFDYFCYVAIPKSIDTKISDYTQVLKVYLGKPKKEFEWRGELQKQLSFNQMLSELYELFDYDFDEITTLKQSVIEQNPESFDVDWLCVRHGITKIDDEIDFDDYNFYRFALNNNLDVMDKGEYGKVIHDDGSFPDFIAYFNDDVLVHSGLVVFTNSNNELFGINFKFYFDYFNPIIEDFKIVNKDFISGLKADLENIDLLMQIRHNSDYNVSKKINMYPEEVELMGLYNEIDVYKKRISELEEKVKTKKQ